MTQSKNPSNTRHFIRHVRSASRQLKDTVDPGFTIDRQRLHDLINSFESLSGE